MSYNKKLSGAKAVFVPIRQLGKNYLPFVEDLRNRYIKYVDFYASQYLPDTDATGLTGVQNMFLSLKNQQGNEYLINNMPLERFDFVATTGLRQSVGAKIALEASYINCLDAANIGTVAMLIFWYDLPEYSRANKSDICITDSLTIPLTTGVRHNIFPDEERMANKRFRRVILGMPQTTPDYQTGLGSAEAANVYITLRKGTYNVIENVPILFLYQIMQQDKSEFANIVFDLLNSYLTIGGANTIPNISTDYIGKSVFFNFIYEK